MYPSNENQRVVSTIVVLAACLLIPTVLAPSVWALTLAEAETIALRADPSVEALHSRRQALEELAIAGGQLPDPVLRTGVMSLPTDSWELGQEPMTQVVVGLTQMFPRGDTRHLRRERFEERAAALDDVARDRRLQLRLQVREQYFEVARQLRLAEINDGARQAFADLAEITEDFYATGRAQQQDVLRASVELARVEDRATRIAADEDQARARLSAWIGDAAWSPLAVDFSSHEGQSLPADLLADIETGLMQHPRMAALQQQVAAADTGVELAQQQYKPEFGVEVAYGGRGGTDMDGTPRSDLFSVMLMMDLPLFTTNRQDRATAASVAESSAALFERDDAYREMFSEARMHAAVLQRQLERRARFEQQLLPDAAFNADAALAAYQAALEDLTTLMRARITEYELQLDYATLLAETAKTRARLAYLQGEEE